MQTFVDSWRGFRLHYPDDWRVLYPPIAGVAFESPDKEVFFELSFSATKDPREAVTERLGRFPPHEARMLENAAEQASALFRDQFCHGQVRARGGVVAMLQARHGNSTDLTSLLREFLSSLAPVNPIARSPWQEPTEHAFGLLCPDGWQVQSALVLPGAAQAREPRCRVHAGPGLFCALEPEFTSFVHGPPQMPGDISLPLNGLRPLLEQFLLPRWNGCRVLEFEDFNNPLEAFVRLQLPDGALRVVKLQAIKMPQMPYRWIGGPVWFIQGPAPALADMEPVFRGVLASMQTDPNWTRREQARSRQMMASQSAQFAAQQNQWMNLQQNLHNQRMHDIHMQGVNNTMIHNTRREIADMQMHGFQQNMASSDRMHHDNINSIRERTDFVDNSGTVYNVDAQHERLWSDGQGHFVGGDWNLQAPANWEELRPWRP
jgi:hypothetical protein